MILAGAVATSNRSLNGLVNCDSWESCSAGSSIEGTMPGMGWVAWLLVNSIALLGFPGVAKEHSDS